MKSTKNKISIIKNKQTLNIILFFLFSFVWTWLFYFLIVGFSLSPYEMPGMILLIIGGCSPSFVGFMMAMITYTKEEGIDYLKSFIKLNVLIGVIGFLLFCYIH